MSVFSFEIPVVCFVTFCASEIHVLPYYKKFRWVMVYGLVLLGLHLNYHFETILLY